LGVSLGIVNSGLRIVNPSSHHNGDSTEHGNSGDGAAGGVSAFASSSPSSAAAGGGGDSAAGGNSSLAESATVNSSTSGGGASTNNNTGYGGLTGLMGRVLGASSPSALGLAAGGANLSNDIEEEDLNISATRPVLPPRAHCVAASNGWIVAIVECSSPLPNINISSSASLSTGVGAGAGIVGTSSGNNQVSSTGGPMMMMQQSKHALTSLIPPLRMVSRWNVRRGTTLGSEGNHLVTLPPPVRTTTILADDNVPTIAAASDNSNNNNDPNFGRIVHAFVDPTGCHVLLSARNGEAYYLHSTSKKVQKLNGFGPHVDGSYSGFRDGVTLGEASTTGDGAISAVVVQTGLTPGSYVTAVGWDRDRGTEGSTKRILLGTSFGELYEYALLSPNSSKVKSSSPFDAKAGEISAMMDDGDNDPIDTPVLLRRLNASNSGNSSAGRAGNITASRSPGGDGGAVGGILFQRIMGGVGISAAAGGGGVIVLASTGGLHRHTRLHTFRSESFVSTSSGGIGAVPSLSLRSAFLRPTDAITKGGREGKSGSFVELPGSVEFAELCSSNDGSFALRTETGIYYGTMERIMMTSSGVSMMGSGSVSSVGLGAAAGGSGGIVDAGMLTYDCLGPSTGPRSSVAYAAGNHMPASIGLTPHHFITLSSTNNVKFINRVAKKVIQEERVDWVSVSQTSSVGENDLHHGGGSWGASVAAELITDIRRPDQIWLRKGRSLVHISSSCEDRDVWKFTLARCIETAAVPHYSFASSAATDGAVVYSANAPLTGEEKHIDSQFEHAKSLCSNSSQTAVVNAVRAEYHLSQGRVELAAKYMAQCPPAVMPFADTAGRLALPMIGRDNNEAIVSRTNTSKANDALGKSNMALITFLSDKMKAAKSKNDSVVCTMLGTWLTELHLQERERRDDIVVQQRQTTGQNHRHTSIQQPVPVNHALLHQFLSSFVRDMDPKSIINVLASHDISAGECAGYSAAAGDIGAAVNAALSGEDEKNGALDALRVLNDSLIEKAEPYYYKYALTLLSRAPMSATKSFVARYTEGLSDTKLLPAFMHYEQRRKHNAANSTARNIDSAAIAVSATFVDDENASIRYMEGVIKLGSQSRAIYNYLTSLYASMSDEGPLFRFLSSHVPPATSSASSMSTSSVSDLLLKQASEERKSPLDKSYALRTILRTGRHFRSAVKLYMGFGMRQQAVELALKVDPALARELAKQSDDKDETKRLWLMIARNAAANGASSRDGKDVVARVVMVLKDCGPDVLSIEDVLPFLPDFAQIDQFKDEICDALASYSSKIEHFLKEMNECDQTCDALRDELSRLKTVGTQVRADARCALTNKYILEEGEPFYAFPSGYVVLETALKQEVIPHLNEKQLGRVKYIENELARVRRSRAGNGRSAYQVAKDDYQIEELQVELGGLIAAECPLTGSVMVDSIDHGFSGDEEDEFD